MQKIKGGMRRITPCFFEKKLGTLVEIQYRSGNQVAGSYKATSRHTEEFAQCCCGQALTRFTKFCCLRPCYHHCLLGATFHTIPLKVRSILLQQISGYRALLAPHLAQHKCIIPQQNKIASKKIVENLFKKRK